jgi:hypothetical protein
MIRRKVLEIESSGAYLSSGLPPEVWLAKTRSRYELLAFVLGCLTVVGLLSVWVYYAVTLETIKKSAIQPVDHRAEDRLAGLSIGAGKASVEATFGPLRWRIVIHTFAPRNIPLRIPITNSFSRNVTTGARANGKMIYPCGDI